MTQLLKVSLPKGVSIGFRLADELPLVEGDPTQIRQVVMNLVINAGEAIGDKQGVITLSTGTQAIDQAYLANCQSAPDAQPGEFLFAEVSDTGHGMSPETLSRIFDPFFTTKFTGRGLGLASVLGIIRGHRGALRVYSELGVGTAFRVLLPVSGPAADRQASVGEPQAWSAGGTVLLVDDEPDIRAVGEKMLAYLGFTVVTATDGAQAVEILRTHTAPFRAAIVDLTMPGMTGEDVVRELRRIQDLPVLVMSGYSEWDVQNRFIGRKKTEFLQKPFTLPGLHAKMRALLGDPVKA
jgi:CheY-like chemotaxis protein